MSLLSCILLIFSSYSQNEGNALYTIKQEKVYLHTDKPFYLIGDTIWLKGYLVDAQSHKLSDVQSRFLYLELIDKKNRVVQRKKLIEENGSFSNFIALSKNVEEGDHQIRAYTRYMRNVDEAFFFTKQISIYTQSPSLLFTKIEYDRGTTEDKYAVVTLMHKDGCPYSNAKVEYMIRTRMNRNRFQRVRTNEDGQIRFKIPSYEDGVEPYVYLTLYEKDYRMNKRIYLPKDYEYKIGFYPEGGHLIAGIDQRIAFKAESSTGESVHIEGHVINRHKDTLAFISSGHGGIGSFRMIVPQDTLYAVTTDGMGNVQRSILPPASRKHISLSVEQDSSHVNYHLLVPGGDMIREPLGLLVHTRGKVLLNRTILPDDISGSIPVSQIPEGITHFAIFNKDTVVVCERLVFVRKHQAIFQVANTENPQQARLPIKMGIRILDEHLRPVQGNFSMSVTDNFAVNIDSVENNIHSHLLLTSDIKGYVYAPGYYFAKRDKERIRQLDELMMTQGWRRFDVNTAFRKRVPQKFDAERIQSIEGFLQTHFDKKAVPDYPLVITAKDTIFKRIIFTDNLGRFSFTHNLHQYGDKLTEFIVRGTGKKKGWRFGIYNTCMDFPDTGSLVWQKEEIPPVVQKIVSEVREGYTLVNGEKIYQLPEVVVNALQLPDGWTSYNVVEPERIQQINSKTALDLLKQIPGIVVTTTIHKNQSKTLAFTTNRDFNVPDAKNVFVTGSSSSTNFASSFVTPFSGTRWSRFWKVVPVLVDGEKLGELESLNDIDAKDVKSVDFVRDKAMYIGLNEESTDTWENQNVSMDKSTGSVMIIQPQKVYISTYLNNGFIPMSFPNVAHIGYLSYAKNAQFYVPKYPSEESRKIVNSDKRTTLHWEPNIRLNEQGEAGISFYTADRPSTYTVVIEGVTDEGKVCRYVKQIK